jgi:hypothetical protein
MDVPDYATPLLGWKTFHVAVERRAAYLDEGRHDEDRWWPAETRQRESRVQMLRTTSETLDVIAAAGLVDAEVCVAIVQCWGHVAINAVSLRATHAYPLALWLPFDGTRRRAGRNARRMCRRLDDYGVRTVAIDRGQWAFTFAQAYADATDLDSHVAAPSIVDGEDHVVVEPIVSPVPQSSVRRRGASVTEPNEPDWRNPFPVRPEQANGEAGF